MKRTNKKGFTIVELVIVIAVIAILAAVLIPNISKLVRKANESSDLSLVRNLNTALTVENKDYATAHEAFEAVKDAGYDLTKIEAKADTNKILYDSENKCFVYLNGTKLEYYPNSAKKQLTSANYYKLWSIETEAKEDGEYTYSVYWNGENDATVTVKGVGFDAGNKKIKNVIYNGADTAHDVVIRTKDSASVVTIDAKFDSVTVYGTANVVYAKQIASTSLHIRGTVSKVLIESGRVVFEEKAETSVVIPTSNAAIIGFSESLNKDNYPFVQRKNGVNSFKIQETNAQGVKKLEFSVTYESDTATSPNVVDNISEAIKNVLNTGAIADEKIGNIANGTSNDGLTDRTHNMILTFEQLKKAASEGGNYKLGANFECTTALTSIPAGKNFKLDLNGHVLETTVSVNKHLVMFENNGEMTISDSLGGGVLKARSVVYNHGKMTLESGELCAIDNGGGAAVWNYKDFLMVGGVLRSTGGANGQSSGATSSSCLANDNSSSNAKITGGELISSAMVIGNKGTLVMEGSSGDMISVKGGVAYFQCIKNQIPNATISLKYVSIEATVGGCIENAGGTATITSCEFKQSGYFDHNSSCVSVSGGGNTIIQNTTIESLNAEKTAANSENYCLYVFSSGGTITVENGVFSGGLNVLRADGSDVENRPSSIVVKGGQFTGTIYATNGATITIEGGTFSVDPTSYVNAEIYSVTPSNSIWTVKKK